ncbi:hypothetical protein NPIL_624211 [Nephila pilipes]|uniref:Uncharacterized protein n=1 Tax=Nephila pilipes TaxID=299642 RepID=A0A8X6U1H1_NEPPI|nr:hypothetical protein NPIL_624211 [Nephila pilipes]
MLRDLLSWRRNVLSDKLINVAILDFRSTTCQNMITLSFTIPPAPLSLSMDAPQCFGSVSEKTIRVATNGGQGKYFSTGDGINWLRRRGRSWLSVTKPIDILSYLKRRCASE